jgi:hypothetical protein
LLEVIDSSTGFPTSFSTQEVEKAVGYDALFIALSALCRYLSSNVVICAPDIGVSDASWAA